LQKFGIITIIILPAQKKNFNLFLKKDGGITIIVLQKQKKILNFLLKKKNFTGITVWNVWIRTKQIFYKNQHFGYDV
jgi:hypothetical protein